MNKKIIEYDGDQFEWINGRLMKKNVTEDLLKEHPEVLKKKAESEQRIYLRSLIGKRALIASGYRGEIAEEIKIIEISPSNDWARTMNTDGRKTWVSVISLKIKEVLN